MVLTKETINEPTNAFQKLSTAKPSMNEAAYQNKAALITITNNPTVRIVIGKVRISRIGRTKTLSNPRMMAAITAG